MQVSFHAGRSCTNQKSHKHSFIHSFIPLACAECDDSMLFSGASSIPLCYVLFPATLLHQPLFHLPSLHLAIYFLVYLSILLFPHSYIILFWEFYFLPFSAHAVSVTVGFLTIAQISLLVNIFQFSFSCHILGLKFLCTLSFQKCSFAFYLSLLVSRCLMHMLMFCLLFLILASLICFYF